MPSVRVAWGSATAPTKMAAYDAALAAANAHNYNLVPVSSVIPADAEMTVVGTLPDLGSAGDRLTVVQSRVDRDPHAQLAGVAGLGWAWSKTGPGILYEATGEEQDSVRAEIRAGIEHGVNLRDWSVDEKEVVLEAVTLAPDEYASAVVIAAYGHSEPIC